MTWATVAAAGIGLLAASENKKAAKKASQTPSMSTSEPWSGAQPYLLRGYGEAQNLLNQGYPQDTANLYRARGLFGSPTEAAARNLATSTLQGNYLNSNPFLDQAVSRAAGEAQTRVNSQFGPFSNYGSSAHQEWLGRGIMEATLPYLNQNYENERGRQMGVLATTPSLSGMDYQNLTAVQQADSMPWDFLGKYQGIVSGLNPGGGTTSSTTPYFSNSANSFLGGALLGQQLMKGFGGGNDFNNWGMNSQTASSFPW